jgi:micrococcal nuclease
MSDLHCTPRLVAVATSLLLVCGCAGPGPVGPPGTATVTDVIDGDTIDVRVRGRTETARLLGIDTPETVKPGAPVECYGPEASARTKELLPPGTKVRMTRDVESRDRYGRLLVYVVRVRDGLFVNLSLVEAGFARPLAIAPNNAYRREITAAAADARAAGRGLWRACPPEN